jgi:hypothetical protein
MGAALKDRPVAVGARCEPSLWPEAQRRRHAALQQALERLENLRSCLIDRLDEMEGDADLEPSLGSNVLMDQTRWAEGSPALMVYAELEEQCEDEGGACEDEGADSDREPDHEHEACHWQDEGDQTTLRPHSVWSKRTSARPSWANLSPDIVPVAQLPNGALRVSIRRPT